MGYGSVHVIEIVGCVVSLEAVSGIEQEHILLAHGLSQAVHVSLHGHKARPESLALDISPVEPGSVHISRSDDIEFTLPRTHLKRKYLDEHHGCKQGIKVSRIHFHNTQNYAFS